MTAYQSHATDTVIRVTSSTYGPSGIAGLAISDLLVQLRKTGETSFSTKALAVSDWVDLGDGFYALSFSEADTDTLGELFYRVTTSGYTDFDEVTGKIDVEAPYVNALLTPQTCLVSGNITDLGGEPGTDSDITWRIAKTPSVSGESVVDGRLLRTRPDAFGNFSLPLLRGKKVVVDIPKAGLKHTITVPDQETANLVDLLPPIVD
jgi:hypothetical protein